ncbi:DUF4116 domain-containing protein [Treponema primitia]|uniref:DUF4116 domain-containing protein n=1 Tax=Treponema primitia TaxID=88058 RepID=UPI00025557E5|nr:DUF4116 domain-containing protein [Treponema primitia]
MTEEKTYKEWLAAVKIDHNALSEVPEKLWTNELCLEAVKKDYAALFYISSERYLTKEVCVEAYKQSPSSIRYVHKDLRPIYAKHTEGEEK